MRILALFIAMAAAFALYGLVFNTAAPIWIYGHQITGRFESGLLLAVCVAALVGIYRRAKIVWWIGWIFLAAVWLDFFLGLLSPSEWQAFQPLWFAVIAHFLIAALAAYFTFRWYQQKTYFTS